MIGIGGVHVEGVYLIQIGVVVGRGPAQVVVEAAVEIERIADPEVAVEIDDAGDGDVGLVVAGPPVEVGIPKQDRVAAGGAPGGEGPGIGPGEDEYLRRRLLYGRS